MPDEVGAETSRPQLLVVVLDLNPSQPLFSRNPSSLGQLLSSVLQLLNSHLMLSPLNTVALVAAHGAGCKQLFPQLTPKDSNECQLLRQQDGQYETFYQVETLVRQGVKELLLNNLSKAKTESTLSGALHMALCYINRVTKSAASLAARPCARILAMSATGDSAAHYINYMNAFFTAQKLAIPVDTCMLGADSGLLQQGSDITGGLYLRVPEQLNGLVQYLTWLFLPPPGTARDMLGAPPPAKVDYRAACFCHRQLVDVGYVCSVCLSIFCKFSPVCTTCHSVFKVPGRPQAKKKKLPSDKK